ncbi:hypothetical protein GW933_00190 [Candidatus Falkowbacteria bacterium]|uniref:Uncharacterized protein n=1 Tax=Candidatus Buchananbacteria bacterium CG10_big_fil_rev_8_21_14_0_10_33_19 TaxID=1974525 RepID=A0A2H0W314_9BACT|nr:hypothetical protein [Candidatus Falkowbacteria bacterium]PIS05677.1 MAG: hypothetical protein COT80_02815 [Candidatus Buchananbacteria bacterium CG10_big_fil_rev_8_21_14_0_10_33_19]
MKNKPYKTIKETPSGRNKKSINLNNLSREKNKELIKKVETVGVPGYHVVKRKGEKKFLRSNLDRRKKNNLDPKINK